MEEKYLKIIKEDKEIQYILDDILKLKETGNECEIRLYWKNGKQYNKKYIVKKLI
nr:MAG TPA: hypothetical protein [Caudoviricetes sp.]